MAIDSQKIKKIGRNFYKATLKSKLETKMRREPHKLHNPTYLFRLMLEFGAQVAA